MILRNYTLRLLVAIILVGCIQVEAQISLMIRKTFIRQE